MIRWIIFSTLATALFHGFYCLAFKRDRWLQLSRWYLMGALLFSLAYPLVRIPELPLTVNTRMELPTFETTGTGGNLPEAGANAESQPPADTATAIPMIIYLAGVAVALLVLLLQFGAQATRVRRLPPVVYLDDDTPPCSFFNHIIIGTRAMSDEELQCVLAHEQEHVRRGHTFDVLLMRLLCCMAWFNPFAWLMLRELRAVHEYQADAAVFLADTPTPNPSLQGGDEDTYGRRPLPEGGAGMGKNERRRVYLRLLYRQTTGFGYGHITNKFNSINIKKRIIMMNKQKSRFGAWKMLAVLPVAAVLMAFGCRYDSGYTTDDVSGKTLISVNYHKEGAKKLPFIGFGYLSCHSKLDLVDETRWVGTVTCQGEGWGTSYSNWELSEFPTSKGRADGSVLNRNEKKLIKAIDRNLRNGKTEGRLVRHARVKATEGKVDLAFVATWRNGNEQGDADILINVIEEGVPGTDSPVVDIAETNPEFVGGMEALYKYLAENIRYPEKAKSEGIQGKIYVNFVIEADGSITNAKVLRGIGGGCDEEAMRVVEAMPKWKPGTVDGKPVRVNYYLPIVFKLNEK